ncbi:MAG TPA: thiamine pyrophosphate-binding protein [Gemmataceae bacterium]|nr:thiamine pyrophosphate-binding protein [Gemmataceae bacterium]
MAGAETPSTGADILVRRLRDLGVSHIFGYPGGQITPIYDALYRAGSIRHVLARDEQAAAFMADGYARATGRPGVCLAVCGPGVLNAATPLATAFTDSIPVLLLSGQVPASGCGLRTGYYHENEQLKACATLSKWQARAGTVDTIVGELDRAYAMMQNGRQGPAILEVPLDVLRAECAAPLVPPPPPDTMPHQPRSKNIGELAALLATWRRPLIIAGGGVALSGAEALLVQLAERLGAPVFHTLAGKAAVPGDHPLLAGLPWHQATSDLTNMGPFMSPLFAQADGLLAVGCRFSQACTGSWSLRPPESLAQIDVDPDELGRHYPLKMGVQADARDALRLLLTFLPTAPRKTWTKLVRRQPPRLAGLDLITPLRRALPRDAIIAADITRLSYMMLADFPVYEPKSFLHPAGFVSMGFGLPAAIGAKAAFPDRTVVAIAGDGCFMMSGMELATAVQEKLPVIVILINDGSLTLIKAIQQRRYENRFLGVDLKNPDFDLFAKAFGVRSWQVETEAAFEEAAKEAVSLGETCLVEVRLRGD